MKLRLPTYRLQFSQRDNLHYSYEIQHITCNSYIMQCQQHSNHNETESTVPTMTMLSQCVFSKNYVNVHV